MIETLMEVDKQNMKLSSYKYYDRKSQVQNGPPNLCHKDETDCYII